MVLYHHGMADVQQDLDVAELFSSAWALLQQGSADRRHAFHTPVMATIDSTGAPQIRTVVLRRVDMEQRLICCHTDSRAPKVQQVMASSRVSWLFYDPAARVQIRASGVCRVHSGASDPIACDTWRQVHPDSRVCYAAPHAPSHELKQWESNQASNARDIAATAACSDDVPPEAFAVLATSIDSLEWLELHHDGHRRIRFDCAVGADPAAHWLAP